MVDYLALIPKPVASTLNVGLSSPKLSTLRSILGEPRSDYTGSCQPITGPFRIALSRNLWALLDAGALMLRLPRWQISWLACRKKSLISTIS